VQALHCRKEFVIHIRRSAIVPHSPQQMFDLVNDVESYPKRFDWCAGAQELQRGPGSSTARLDLRVAGMTQSFTTQNELVPGERISMSLLEGPFRTLHGEWTFKALGEHGCKISFVLDFEYANRMLAPLVRVGFEKLADRLVGEFSAEAERVYA